jgi:hypothetical protein
MADKPDNKEPKKVVPGGTAMTSEVELLSTSVGRIDGKVTLILAIRPDPKNTFAYQNFGISKSQAVRLRADLEQLFTTSALLNEPDPEEKPKKPRKPRKPKNK